LISGDGGDKKAAKSFGTFFLKNMVKNKKSLFVVFFRGETPFRLWQYFVEIQNGKLHM